MHLGRWQETDVAIKSLSSLTHIAITTDITSGSTRSSSEDSKAPDVDATMRTLEREVTISLDLPNVISHFKGVQQEVCVHERVLKYTLDFTLGSPP